MDDTRQFLFWQRWLTYANVLTVGVGLLPFKNWLFGIIGGTIVGFHLLIGLPLVMTYRKFSN